MDFGHSISEDGLLVCSLRTAGACAKVAENASRASQVAAVNCNYGPVVWSPEASSKTKGGMKLMKQNLNI